MTNNTTVSSFDTLKSNNLVKISLECLWLATVGLIPLVFISPASQDPLIFPYQIPKVTLFRMLVGVLIALSMIDLTTVFILRIRNLRQFNPVKGILQWLRSDPSNWIIFFILAYLMATIISTSFSPSFGLSLWGKDPAADGYSLYNVISYLMLCAILIRYIQSHAQIFRLLATVAISGWLVSAYGILQYFGMGPLGVVQTEQVRVSSTMGNPLFVGNFLLITIPLTLGIVGLQWSTASNASILILLEPAAILVFARILLGEQLRPRHIVGVACGLFGAMFIVTEDADLSVILQNEHFKGNAILFAHGILWGLYSPLIRDLSRKYDPVSLTLSVMTIAMLVLGPAALTERHRWLDHPDQLSQALIYTGKSFMQELQE